jgi:hypothetical protein
LAILVLAQAKSAAKAGMKFGCFQADNFPGKILQ